MKKVLVLLLVGALVLSIGAFAFADSTATPEWFKDMIKWKKDQVKEAVKAGEITEEQAEDWNEHIEYMEEYHNENGFDFPGGCGNTGFGRHNRRGFGQGSGMNRGFNWNSQSK